MDEQVRALVSALDAIGYTRQQDPRVLKQMARDALNGFMSAQHSVQSDGGYCDCKNIVAWVFVGEQAICPVCKRPRR